VSDKRHFLRKAFMFRHIFSLVLLVFIVLLSSCAPVQQLTQPTIPSLTNSTTTAGEITVAAAADLQFAFTDIAKAFEQQTGHKVILVFGSTGQLAQQIENGAPYDLFAAADLQYVNQLADKGLAVRDSVAMYARGRIVLAVNRKSGAKAVTLQDLVADQIYHIAIANPEHAPYGVAAKQALQAVGVWDQIQSKLVYGENVRQTLQYLQTGDAQVGIISLSVANVPEITWTLIDGSLHKPLDQGLAVMTSSKNPELAAEFIRYINGETGRPIMRQYGFLLPDEINALANQQQPNPTP
jgi:molybdate transport system substrate-binding protein